MSEADGREEEDGEGFEGMELVAASDDEVAGEDAGPIRKFANPPVSESPVIPLGYFKGRVVFAMPEGEIRDEPARHISQMLQTDIYACQAGQAFLSWWREGEEDKFQRVPASIWFVRKCREAGLWDETRPQRSLGVWPGPTSSSVILHRGSEIWVYQRGKRLERHSVADMLRAGGREIYILRPPGPLPGKKATVADGAWVRSQLDRWHFEAIGDEGLTGADVVAGWLMAALLGGAAPFRGHLLLNAMAGSGKTTLMEFIRDLLSALQVELLDSLTDAGFRADLAGKARPNLLDEQEASAADLGGGMVERVLEILRRMATGAGSNRKQADGHGGTTVQTAVGAVMVAAINPPRLQAADASRIVEVKLSSLSGYLGPDGQTPLSTQADLEAMNEAARALAPKLLQRALMLAGRYRDDVAALKGALYKAGQNPRAADLLAMIVAGHRLLLQDEPLTPQEAADQVALWQPLIDEREALKDINNPGVSALAHLMSASTGVHTGSRLLNVGQLINEYLDDFKGKHLDDLKAMGLSISRDRAPDGRDGPWLYVSNTHPMLARIFAPTPWKDWPKTFAYLDDLGPTYETWHPKSAVRFGTGQQSRAVVIPLAPWLDRPGAVTHAVPLEAHVF